MPPTRAARWMTMSLPSTALLQSFFSIKLNSFDRGTEISVHPLSLSASPTTLPRKPAPPVTPRPLSCGLAILRLPELFPFPGEPHVCIHHQPDTFLELYL